MPVFSLSEDITVLREYERLSPFEIKYAFTDRANKAAKKVRGGHVECRAGKPNWTAVTPREGPRFYEDRVVGY
jgi:hypothetical protein